MEKYLGVDLSEEQAREVLKDIAISEAQVFLKREDVPEEEKEAAFAGYCTGYIDGFTLAVKAIKARDTLSEL